MRSDAASSRGDIAQRAGGRPIGGIGSGSASPPGPDRTGGLGVLLRVRNGAAERSGKKGFPVDPADVAPFAPDPAAAAAQWTARDDAKLQASFAVAGDLDEICAATGKAPEAVLNRLVRLKLVASKAAARGLWG